MFFNFIDTAYSFIIVILLAASLFAKGPWKKYCSNFIAVSNNILIYYAIYLICSLVDLIRLVLSLNVKLPENTPVPPIGWFEIRYVLLMVLPFLFISKQIAGNRIASLIMLILLQWEIVEIVYNKIFVKGPASGLLFYISYNMEFKIMHFISLFIGTYALLWLLKRLPGQQANK